MAGYFDKVTVDKVGMLFEQFGDEMENDMDKYKRNKFYVGSETVFGRNWGHTTLNAAVEHARSIMDRDNRDETFVVQIVRVIRKKPVKTPIEIITVK